MARTFFGAMGLEVSCIDAANCTPRKSAASRASSTPSCSPLRT
jgi:hypothetical protein